jgi:hypothetical protein
MQNVLDEYNESSMSRDKIIKEFNEIVCDEILDNVNDVSQYPVYDISKDTDSHEVLS